MSRFAIVPLIETQQYDNGLRLIYQKSPSVVPLTSIQVFCNVGSAFEIDKHRGMAHMVEHMVFKGTEDKLPREIFEMFDKYGAQFNAYTTKRLTCYTFKCDSEYVEECLPIMSDMLFHSTFPKKEYEKEKEVVKQENIRDKNDESRINYQNFCEIVYNGSSYVYPVDTLEYHDEKNEWSLKQVIEWYNHYYQPQHMVLSIVSSLSFSKIKHIINKSGFTYKVQNPFGHAPMGLRFPMNNLPLKQKSSIVCGKKNGMTNTHIMVGFPCYSYHDNKRYCISLLSQLLNGMSGRLFMLLREKTPLTYRVFSETEYEEYRGYFSFVVECSNDNLFEYKSDSKSPVKPGVIPILVKLTRDLYNNGITQQELNFAKTQIRNATMMNYEDIDNFCEYNGRYELIYNHKDFVSFDKLYEEFYKPITLKEVNHCIRETLNPKKMVVTLLSNKPPTTNKVKKYCF